MNLEFCDKLSSTTFHNTANLEQNREFFTNWLRHKLMGAFCDRETDFEDGPRCPRGTLGTLHISVNTRDVTGTGTYALTSREFDWWISEVPVDRYGLPVPGAAAHTLLAGGLYNHGTTGQPCWSSNT